MVRLALGALICALAAGCPAPPEIKPPPYGPDSSNPSGPRLFFPTGIAVAPSGTVLVVNGNFDRAFDFGSISAISGDFIEGIFASPPADTNDPNQPLPVQIPASAFTGNAITGSYGGPLLIDDRQGRGLSGPPIAVFGSRDSSTLNGVQLNPDGSLTCVGSPTEVDCRNGLIDLTDQQIVAPFGLTAGSARLPGSSTDVPVVFVSSLTPWLDLIDNNTVYSRGRVAALRADDPTQPLFATDTSNYNIANGIAGGPIVFDDKRRTIIQAGCYQLYPTTTNSTPSTGKCGTGNISNLLRFVGVDEGNNAEVQLVDISAYVRSNDTSGLALGGFDSNGIARTLYAAVRAPDLIAEIDLPLNPTEQPTVKRAAPLPVSPSNVLLLQRPATQPGRDLLAITASGSDSLDIYDTTASQVVARVEGLGDTPYALAQLPVQPGDTSAKLVVSVFGACRIALIDVSYAQPWQSRLRARLGSCPQ
ncbi:MAG: hypothetical protein JST92_25900 [Deltaproteobacteria bacterium]|nr:hypothetical protein [Deltaproteobacteria bacterium]